MADSVPECTFCGAQGDLAVDHIMPKSRGGRYHPGNLQWLCRPCNSKKRDRTNDEYLLRLCDFARRPEFEAALTEEIGIMASGLVAECGSVEGAIRAMYRKGHIPGKPLPVAAAA